MNRVGDRAGDITCCVFFVSLDMHILAVAARAELIVSCFVRPGPQPVPTARAGTGNAMRVTWALGCLLRKQIYADTFTTIVTIQHEGYDVSCCCLIIYCYGSRYYTGNELTLK